MCYVAAVGSLRSGLYSMFFLFNAWDPFCYRTRKDRQNYLFQCDVSTLAPKRRNTLKSERLVSSYHNAVFQIQNVFSRRLSTVDMQCYIQLRKTGSSVDFPNGSSKLGSQPF